MRKFTVGACVIDRNRQLVGQYLRQLIDGNVVLGRHLAPEAFDAVILNGVLGSGIDDAGSVDRALRSIATVLKPRGRLVIGWNNDKAKDPKLAPAANDLFRPCALLDGAAHLTLEGSTMIYDFLEKA